MVKRSMIIGLLGISMAALSVNDVSAALWCNYINPVTGQKMCISTGSLVCGITASGFGNDITYLGCAATATDNWAVACGNPGENTWTAPGINVVEFEGTFSEDYLVTPEDVDKNGKASVLISNKPPQSVLDALEDSGACPNVNWEAIDAVPCSMNVQLQQFDEFHCLEADLWLSCKIDCGTLQWDVVTQTFEQRAYECEQTSKHTYRTPICPSP